MKDIVPELYKKIKPIVTINNIKYLMIDYDLLEIKYHSYFLHKEEEKIQIIDSNKLDILDDFICLNTWDDYNVFQPSVAEILYQMPSNLVESADFFEVVEWPKCYDDTFRYPRATDNGFHLSKVRTYRLK